MPPRSAGPNTIDRAVFLLTCNLGSTAATAGDCISLHSSFIKVNAGTEYVNFGIRYNRYDQSEALRLRQLPVITVAYSKEMDLSFFLAEAFDPLGEMYTPSVLKPAYGLIRGTGTGVVSYPAVRRRSPGYCTGVDITAIPSFHRHEIRVQKLFWRFNAPPVVNKSRSQLWASACKELSTDSTLVLELGLLNPGLIVDVLPSWVSSTNTSPLLCTSRTSLTALKKIAGTS